MRTLLLLLVLWPFSAFAVTIANTTSFDFSGVSVVAFGQSTYKNLLGRDFVISPDVVAMDRKITVSVRNLETEKIAGFVENILAQQGISSTFKDGVYYLSMASKPTELRPVADSTAPASPAFFAPADKAGSVDGRAATATGRAVDDESTVYVPVNRPSDFLAAVVTGAFGERAVVVAGGKIVLTGSKAELKKMIALLGAVDAMPKLVDVSASWVEVTDNAGSSRGISLLASVLGAKLGASLGAVNSGSAISLRNTSFQLVVDALNSDGRFKQVSNSRVVGDDYEKLVLSVGDETPTISSAGKDNAGNPVQNIVYRPSGVIVDVLPKVLGGGRIQLAVDGQISSFKATATGVTGSPTLIKRQVKTRVTVADGEVLLIGGLNDTQTSSSSSSLPFLPSSWSIKSGSKVQTDLVLVLSAKVATSD